MKYWFWKVDIFAGQEKRKSLLSGANKQSHSSPHTQEGSFPKSSELKALQGLCLGAFIFQQLPKIIEKELCFSFCIHENETFNKTN